MKKFKNKYRIPSTRLPHWDYARNAAYFITICTRHRVHYFGEVVDGGMVLSEIGAIVQSEWLKTFEMRPDMNLWQGAYVVMPDHFHAIIGIGDNAYNSKNKTHRRDAMHCVSTSDHKNKSTSPKNKFGPQSKNLASIIRGFKIGVTKNARLINPDFEWQSRYHDHIIRNEKSFQSISNYIIHNPAKWQDDKLYPSDL